MNTVLFAVLSVTSIGLICSVVLSIASKIMFVKIDERVTLLSAAMPGVNCGACGYPGCSAYASALVSDGVKPNLCTPGGADVLKKISEILQIETGSIVKKTAVVNCMGDNMTQKKKMEYKGIQTCAGAKQLFSGQGSCAFGCIGYGDCQAVCPSSAVCMDNGLARIITDLCTGCGLCVKACPNKIISIEDASIPVMIACKNIEKGAVTKKKCSIGCIACTKCVKECPEGAITMADNLARIDYAKCKLVRDKQSCGKCVEVCMTKCIRMC